MILPNKLWLYQSKASSRLTPPKSLADNVQGAFKRVKEARPVATKLLLYWTNKTIKCTSLCKDMIEPSKKSLKLEETAIKESTTEEIPKSCNRGVADKKNHQTFLAGFRSRLSHLRSVTQLWGRCLNFHYSPRRSGQIPIWAPISCSQKVSYFISIARG